MASSTTWSRAQHREVITWAIKVLFDDDIFYDGAEEDPPSTFEGPMRKVLKNHQLVNWHGITTLRKEDIDDLHYYKEPDDIDNTPIPVWQKSRLHQLVDFTRYMEIDMNAPLRTPQDWMAITGDQFKIYAVQVWKNDSNTSNSTPTSRSPSSASQGPLSKAALFKKGIKRDPTLFPVLKCDNNFDIWRRSMETQARAQAVFEPLDPNYKPSNAEDIELFTEQNIYKAAVFEKNVQTSMGRSIFRTYNDTSDAQSMYRDLLDHALRSTGATIDASKLLTYLTTIRLGDGKWKGTTKDFILHFQEQVQKYNEYVSKEDALSEALQKSLLENSVHPITDLRRIKEQATQIAAANGNTSSMTNAFAQYVTLLISAAQSYDSQFEDVRKPGGARRVFMHDIDTAIEDIFTFDADDGEMETTPIYDVNQSAMQLGARLPK